ncbi:anthranilate phosphoribosyltransferase [Bacillus mesophilus]|uniref:Anthranilate phosphoribosyltransferase n=1 Tax=Bacillus mesophilus TaxID=1808955 RepID=A0A6M0Q4Q5_9BACI|nr:anthranilate phosphoribosyltransferase [Bacillus mesophilus]NEY71222.1 anthranilate phosphoribosyltransferase [Bacillus mesophilus]
MLRNLLHECIEGKTLSRAEAEEAMNEIMSGEATSSQIASLLSILRFRGETTDELTGFAQAMRKHMNTLKLDNKEEVIDTCGTGGDGVSSFNISTASAIIASSLGIKVAKHGNRAVSSKSGSADVLEQLGISIQSTPEEANQALKETNMTFLFAPNYHAAMKHAVAPRKEIGFRTVFNLLGPLSNPAQSKRQVIGVYDTKLALKMAETLKTLGSTHVLFVTGRDGLDEISITTDTDVVELKDGQITSYTIHPSDFQLPVGNLDDIRADSVEESAKLILNVFNNLANESARNTLILNAGAAIYVSGKAASLKEGVDLAREAIDTKKVIHHLQELSSKEVHHYA